MMEFSRRPKNAENVGNNIRVDDLLKRLGNVGWELAELTGYQNSSNCTCRQFFEAKLRGIYPKRLNFKSANPT